jgi:uncharacterized protein (DUF983 family)
VRRALTLFGRAVLVHCPDCGSSGLFEHWFKIKERCPRCGHVVGRNESGYQLGSMALDMIIPMLLWLGGLALTLILTWPNPPWAIIQWGSIAIMVGLPLLLYPMSHTLAIALDLLVRPSDSVSAGRADPARAGRSPGSEETD